MQVEVDAPHPCNYLVYGSWGLGSTAFVLTRCNALAKVRQELPAEVVIEAYFSCICAHLTVWKRRMP